jgi:hypothetical protein
LCQRTAGSQMPSIKKIQNLCYCNFALCTTHCWRITMLRKRRFSINDCFLPKYQEK